MIKKTYQTSLICFNPQKKNNLKKINKKIEIRLNSKDIKFFNSVTKGKIAAPGTSKLFHLAFFKKFTRKKILMLGVYHGVDLKLMNYFNKNAKLIGVDRLNADYCEDWPKEKRSLSWEDGGYGSPPSARS